MDDEPAQEALFQIEGPDEDGCVWACSTDGRDVWLANLAPRDKAAAVMSQWLASQDCDERAPVTSDAKRDLDRRLRSLANYCRHLSRELLDPRMKKTFEDAAKHFDEEAMAFRSQGTDH